MIATLLAAYSAEYFFRHPLYELGDSAANSLSVNRAKHFAELYGPYSRWGFHHPGPALFYVMALGEWLFFDTLQIVPAPFNAQTLICLFVEVGFFMAALQVFVHWLPFRCRWWFFPLAILSAAWFFGHPAASNAVAALPAGLAFQTTWGPHFVVLVFLCLLTAGASVAAGRAQELPLLVLAAGFLVHCHVAQPLFVVPCSLLAYTGLIGQQRSTRPTDQKRTLQPELRRALARLAAPWKNYTRVHRVAGVILAIFVLPIFIDLCRGADSNFALLLHHIHSHEGQHNSLAKSLVYFLLFAAQTSYQPGREDFGHFDAAGVEDLLRVHAPVYTLWGITFGLVILMMVWQIRQRIKRRETSDAGRFLVWGGIYLFLAIGLTLRWGVIQDGEMFYYNAWFNFAIYFFAALIALGTLTLAAQAALKRWGDRGSGLAERGITVLAAIGGILLFAAHVKIMPPAWQPLAGMHDRVTGVIAKAAAPKATKFLDFPQLTWPYMAAVAVELDRAGEKFVVPARWRTMFGAEHASEIDMAALARVNYQKWTLVEPREAASKINTTRKLVPLLNGIFLTTDPLPVFNPDGGGISSLDFRSGSLSPGFEITGWSGSEEWGEWIAARRAVLTFRTLPVKGDVKMTIDAFPYLDPAHGLRSQRLITSLNSEQLGPELRLDRADQPPVVITIPKAVWNRVKDHPGADAILELDLPDAIAPQELDPTKPGESRALALGVRHILLQAQATEQASSSHPAGWFMYDTAEAGVVPDGYAFDGKPSEPSFHQGIFDDGWAGPQATVLLPRANVEASFLRLEGSAPQRPGIVYPYRFTTQVDDNASTEFTIPAPGTFEILVPLTNDKKMAGKINVHFTFPQTFAPLRTDAGSHDDRELSLLFRSLRINSDAQPMFTCFRGGWYEWETNQRSRWQWSQAESVVELAVGRAGTLIIKGDLGTQVPGNSVDLLLDGKPLNTVPLNELGWLPFEQRLPVAAGKHALTFRSRLPGVQPPSETRMIAFGMRDAEFKLK